MVKNRHVKLAKNSVGDVTTVMNSSSFYPQIVEFLSLLEVTLTYSIRFLSTVEGVNFLS